VSESPDAYEVKITVGDATVEVSGAEAGVVRIVEALTGVLGGVKRGGATEPEQKRIAVTDPRTLFDSKAPRSQNEGVVVAAYYLQELAPEAERTEVIDGEKVAKVFRQARFKLPKNLPAVLVNTQAAGYLDRIGAGEYRLNPVGWNLVVHTLGSE